jgi:hypothetical protein
VIVSIWMEFIMQDFSPIAIRLSAVAPFLNNVVGNTSVGWREPAETSFRLDDGLYGSC